MKITSLHNPQIKQAVDLRQRRHRDATGMTLVEGVKEVLLAVSAGVEIEQLFICEELADPARQENISKIRQSKPARTIEISKDVFEKLSFGDRKEGVMAVCRIVPRRLADMPVSRSDLYGVVDGVEKPGNLGAILRTCDAAGVTGLFVSGAGTDLYNPNVIRASLGTVFTVPVVAECEERILDFLRKNRVAVIAAVPSARKDYDGVDFRKSCAVLLGSEHAGLNDFWRKNADISVKIPMAGQADSLNVSNSAAILFYEARRQRMRS